MRSLVSILTLISAACTSFATVRSAEVLPGPSVAVHASLTMPPGDDAGWFWSYDCSQACDHAVVGGDIGFTYGWPGAPGGKAFAVGAGTSGLYPYVDGYVQLTHGRSPFGIGVRVGAPVSNWREHQLYGRYDVPLGSRTRLLVNPAAFLHEGHSPNGENPGTFVGFVQGVGLLLEGDRVSWTPAVALVAGRARRTSYGEEFGPTTSVFGTASIGVTFHRSSRDRRQPPER